ncbi:MAG TPA: PASTA domain-containing protein, partial [Caulobacteraceae bacterium]
PPGRGRAMIASGRAVTLALLGLCALVAQVPARAQVNASRTAVVAQSGAKPRPKPLPPRRPIPPPYPVRPPPPAPPPKPRPSLMPKVTGLPLAGAEAALARQGLKPSGVARVASNAQPNTVVDQQPRPGQAVSEASPIVLSVANSAVMVRVPDLRGLTPQQAGPTLRAVGLTPGRIVGTRPGPRAPAERGSAVDYQVAQAPPPIGILPPPPPPPPPAQSGGQGEAPRPVTPTPMQPAPVPPAPVQPVPVGRGPPSSAPASSAPESSAPVSSAPTSSAPAPGAPAEAAAPPLSGPPAATGPLDWARTHPGWLAALAAALAAAAAGGWALRRRAAVPSAPVIPVAPVAVTVSMLTAPTSTIENAQPAAGPAIGIAWTVGPPETHLQTPEPKEPSP